MLLLLHRAAGSEASQSRAPTMGDSWLPRVAAAAAPPPPFPLFAHDDIDEGEDVASSRALAAIKNKDAELQLVRFISFSGFHWNECKVADLRRS